MTKKSGVGVTVVYCGHDASFLADIIEVAGACVVIAASPVGDRTLTRPASPRATHHLVDWPKAGYWSPNKGLFIVPNAQVRLITPKDQTPKPQNVRATPIKRFPDLDGPDNLVCARCGLPWPNPKETEERHKCPQGFMRKRAYALPKKRTGRSPRR